MQNKENCSREIWNNEQNLTQLEINKMLIVDFFFGTKSNYMASYKIQYV